MTQAWHQQQETGSQVMRKFLVWSALHLRRSIVQIILVPIAAYFVLFSSAARKASQDYLRRVLGRKSRLHDVYRHLFCFAVCSVDRLYLLSGSDKKFSVQVQGEELFDRYCRENRGAILIITHTGNFDVMRVRGSRDRKLKIKILLNRQHNAGANSLIEAMDTEMAKHVIDADRPPNELVLEIQQALQDGYFVGIMADRARAGESTVTCQFLGAAAEFPSSPWLISAVLKAPVILCFAFFRGQNRYEICFEQFAETLSIPRKTRQQDLLTVMQRFVDRLQYHLKAHPYNWFNFYSFWHHESAKN